MQNQVLATAFKGMISALPADIAQDVVVIGAARF